MSRPTPSLAASQAHGKITWVTALLLALVAGGGFLLWTYLPVYVVHYEVKHVVHEYANQAVRNKNDAELVEKMIHKLRTLDEMEVPDQRGRLRTVPTVLVSPRDVTWERDAQSDPPTLFVALSYTRPVKYPLIDRWTEATLSVEISQDISIPDWGPSR